MRAAPAVSCAKSFEKVAHEHTGQRRQSDFPCAMLYGLYVITLATGFLATIARAP